ncbi:MAG: hypothetical protein ACWGON_09500 [Gemmatimonadota bacterium]
MGRSGVSPLLAIIAIIAIAGFFYWLNLESEGLDTVVAPVMEDELVVEAIDLNTAAIAADLEGSIGEEGWIRFATVDERLGRAAFTVSLDAETSLPVLLSPDLIRRGTDIYGNDRVSMFGKLFVLNDSIRNEWVGQGAVDGANAGAIPATPGFFLADSLSIN